jgi:hypothetical protein
MVHRGAKTVTTANRLTADPAWVTTATAADLLAAVELADALEVVATTTDTRWLEHEVVRELLARLEADWVGPPMDGGPVPGPDGLTN